MGRFILFWVLLTCSVALGAQESALEVLSPTHQGFRRIEASNIVGIAKVLGAVAIRGAKPENHKQVACRAISNQEIAAQKE
jgi:hypothetical protein